LHWSITQFTPASVEVAPVNVLERIYTVIVVLIAMVVFSSLVSSITNAMTNLRNMQNNRLQSEALLRRYLLENEISSKVVMRVWRSVSKKRWVTKRVCESEVALLRNLPEALVIEIHTQVYMPVLHIHPFFNRFSEDHYNVMLKICHFTTEQRQVHMGTDLFAPNEVASAMLFVTLGTVVYWLDTGVESMSEAGTPAKSVHKSISRLDVFGKDDDWLFGSDSWFCEGALWMKWLTRGQAKARTHVELVCFDVRKLHAIMKQELLAFVPFAKYAESCCSFLRDSITSDKKLTDIWIGTNDEEDLSLLQDMVFEVFDSEEHYPPRARKSRKSHGADRLWRKAARRGSSTSSLASGSSLLSSVWNGCSERLGSWTLRNELKR